DSRRISSGLDVSEQRLKLEPLGLRADARVCQSNGSVVSTVPDATRGELVDTLVDTAGIDSVVAVVEGCRDRGLLAPGGP
ncbi:hypothetical protein ACW2Q0_29920, partial [Nocardia sp. R16R-3T]